MTPDAAQLLRALGAGVRQPADRPAETSFDGADFGDLLRRAERGELSSGRAVRPGAALGEALTPTQIDRMSRAADAAELAGSNALLVVMEGRAFRIDISSRGLEAARADDAVRTDVDAAVVFAGDDEEGDSRILSQQLAAPGGAIENAALLHALTSTPTGSDQ